MNRIKKINLSLKTFSIRILPLFKQNIRVPLLFLAGLITLFIFIYLNIGFTDFNFPFLTEKTVREGLVGQPQNIIPIFAHENEIDQLLSKLIFRGLVVYDENGNWFGDLADKIEISEDGLSYAVALKSDIFWDDGKKITSDDIIFTYQLTQAPDYIGFWREAFKGITFEKTDDTNLTIKLSEPLSSFPQTLNLGIIPKHIFEQSTIKSMFNAHFGADLIGNGSYKIMNIKYEGREKDRIKLIRLQIKNAKAISALEFHFYPTEDSLLQAFKEGEIDTFQLTDASKLDSLAGWNNYNLYQTPLLLRFYNLYFNCASDKSINKAEVRQALSKITDRQGLIKTVFGDVPVPAAFGPISRNSWAYSDDVQMIQYNLEDGKKQLEDEGIKDLTLTLTVLDTPLNNKVGTALQQQWEQAGVKLEIRKVAAESFEKDVLEKRDYEVLFYGQEISEDPDQYPLWHSTRTDYPGLNISQIKSKWIDKDLEEGRQLLKQEDRKQKYIDFQKHFQNEAPIISLYHPLFTYLVQKRVKGVNLTDMFFPEDRFDNLAQWYVTRPKFVYNR